MGTSDGTVLGVTKIVDHGPDADMWNLVITGDGFQSGSMSFFADVVDNFVSYLQTVAPFTGALIWDAVNVYRLDVESNDFGADNPNCNGALVDTYFDAEFCVNGNDGSLVVDESIVIDEATTFVPEWDALLVFVHHFVRGGSARGGVGAASTYSSLEEPPNDTKMFDTAIHELGHAAFGLADEYCDSDRTTQNHYPAIDLGEPPEPNVSAALPPKWHNLILPTTPEPTTTNPDCTQCDPLKQDESPVAIGTVGSFEGAKTYQCSIWRPEFNCCMRENNQPFCAVCHGVIFDRVVLTSSACFVAGVVYGGEQHPDVATLRDWRDWHLRQGAPGRSSMRALVAVYARVGPPMARAMRTRPRAARLLREHVFSPWAAALRRRAGVP